MNKQSWILTSKTRLHLCLFGTTKPTVSPVVCSCIIKIPHQLSPERFEGLRVRVAVEVGSFSWDGRWNGDVIGTMYYVRGRSSEANSSVVRIYVHVDSLRRFREMFSWCRASVSHQSQPPTSPHRHAYSTASAKARRSRKRGVVWYVARWTADNLAYFGRRL